jgi:hypothetical protein
MIDKDFKDISQSDKDRLKLEAGRELDIDKYTDFEEMK